MLETRIDRMDNMTILDISGRIDAVNSNRLQVQIDNILEDEATEKILLLRMAEVNYLSAAGLRVLRVLHHNTGQVHIIEPSNRVVEVMEMTGLDAVYNLYNSLDDVVN